MIHDSWCFVLFGQILDNDDEWSRNTTGGAVIYNMRKTIFIWSKNLSTGVAISLAFFRMQMKYTLARDWGSPYQIEFRRRHCTAYPCSSMRSMQSFKFDSLGKSVMGSNNGNKCSEYSEFRWLFDYLILLLIDWYDSIWYGIIYIIYK